MQASSPGVLVSAKAMAFIVVRDRDAAKAFYGGTLGFSLVSEDDFAVAYDLDGTMLRISAVADHSAQPHTVLGWQVADIRAAASSLRQRGVVFKRYAGLDQDDLGIWLAPGSRSKVAWFSDPDGNILSLAESPA